MILENFLKKELYGQYFLLSNEELIPLDDLSSDTEKVEKLTTLLEIPTEEFNERRSLCVKLRELLRKYYPDCLLLMFGGSVNGFGIKSSNLNLLFLPFPDFCNSDYPKVDKCPIPDPASVLTGKGSRDVLSKLNEFCHLKFIWAILCKEKDHVEKANFIATNTPSVKLYINNSNVICNISASNKLVVFNSELLQFLVKLDGRVKPLVIVLLFWARSLGFVRKSYFSNYGFTLLVIFFLQNTKPPVLPSVKKLMDVAGFNRMVAGWQTAFTTDMNLIPKSNSTSTVGELLMQFFEFYWNFDFVQNVVSPHTGSPINLKDLKGSVDEKLASFGIASFNIQDPFNLSENVCAKKHAKIVFKLAMYTAYHMLQDKSGRYKFHMLFDVGEYRKVLYLHYNIYMQGKLKIFFINLEHDYANKQDLSKYIANPQLWFRRASEAVFDVLQYGLLIECEVTDKISWGKKVSGDLECKPLKQDCTPYNLELLMSIQCVLYSRTWIGRENIADVTMNGDCSEKFSGSALKEEYSISNELVTKNPSVNSSVPLACFQCECYKHSSPQIPDIVIMIKPLMHSREFNQVSIFLSSFIPKTVKKILTSD